MPIGYHIVLGLLDGRTIATTPLARCQAVRSVLEQGRDFGLLSFSLADTHLHMQDSDHRDFAGELARQVESSITQRLKLKVGFRLAHFTPMNDQRHMYNTFRYIQTQHTHHELTGDPWHEVSSLPDLLGMRITGRYLAARVRSHLPRVTRSDLLGHAGLPDVALVRFDAEQDLRHLAAAGASASGLSELSGYSRETTAVRRAIIEIVDGALPSPQLTSILGVSRRTISRLRHEPPSPELTDAIRKQLFVRRKHGVSSPTF